MSVPLQHLHFRPFEQGDAAVLERWLNDAGLGVPKGVLQDAWSRRLMEDERIYARVAIDGTGAARGFVRLDVGPDRKAEITLICEPGSRRQGVGSALLAAALAEARARGLKRLLAVIDGDNRAAREFFLAGGFEIVGSNLAHHDQFERVVHSADRQPPLEILP